MFIPFGTDRPLKRPTLVTYWLLALNLVIFVVCMAIERNDPERHRMLLDAFMLYPAGAKFRWWQLVTYQFLHANWAHILGNMLVLFVFGPPVEDRFGKLGFAAFYIVGGMASGAVHMLFENAPVLGASGAISGVTGAFLVLFPLTRIRMLIFFFIVGVYQIPAWWFIAFAIAKDIVFQGFGHGQVAYTAHLGGYLYGGMIAAALLWARAIPREPYDLFSMGRQAQRRRAFRALAGQGSSPWRSDIPGKAKVAANARDAAERDGVNAARAQVLARVSSGDLDGAAEGYLAMLDLDADAALSRDAQLMIANHLARAGRHPEAVAAYERFIARYPSDREVPNLKLMIALFSARYLNDPVRASALLGELRRAPLDEVSRHLADQLAQEIA